jgi:ABC-type multidrug transport system fused ATPase/permease subunit
VGNVNLILKVWRLLTKSEQKKSFILLAYLLVGTVLELLSVGVLLPLIRVLTQSDLNSKFDVFERYFPNSSDQLIVTTVLLLVVFTFLVKEVFLGFSLWAQRSFVSKLETRFQTEIFNKYSNQPYDFHLSQNSSLLSRNILNSNNFIFNIVDPIFILLTDGLVAIALCIVLVVIEPISMLVTIGFVSLVATLFHRYSKNRIETWGQQRQWREAIRLKQMNETFGGIKEISILGRGDYFRKSFEQNVNELSLINRKFTTIIGIPRLYLELLAIIGLAALVISMLALGRTSETMLPILGVFAGGAFRLMPAINRITFALQSFRMGAETVSGITQQDYAVVGINQSSDGYPTFEFQSKIELKSVSYSYPGEKVPSLSEVGLEILKGSEVGIIGATGAGKSTLVDVFLGLLSPTKGSILVDGVDISRNLRGWQDLIGYVPQSIFLSDETIEANVGFGIPESEIDESKVWQALEQAQLKSFVESLPNGKRTIVGERGVRLSGGQRQRIGIARALYLDPPILVFDEATSALDIETEKEVMSSLNLLRRSKTILIVTHRLSALDKCDQIIEIENGRMLSK